MESSFFVRSKMLSYDVSNTKRVKLVPAFVLSAFMLSLSLADTGGGGIN